MRVLMLSWEYPPVLVGGLGRHVHALATTLAAAGHDVTVVTWHVPGALREEYAEGVRIIRAPDDPPQFEADGGNLLGWTMAFNHTLTRAALRAALEAAAAGTPVAVADTGGLAEIVEHGVTGVKFPSQDPSALAASVSAVLGDREYARVLARQARRRVREEFTPGRGIAARTVAVYEAVEAGAVARAAQLLVDAAHRQSLHATGHTAAR